MPASSSLASSSLDLIGRTPLIALSRIYSGPGRVVAKAEFLQPGGSIKDRAAKAILQAALGDGRLRPGMPVVEMTSGNMGAGLAVACAALGHPLVVTMSAGNSPARARMLEGLGAEVILVDQVDGAPGQVTGADVQAAARMAQDLAAERGGFYVNQFHAVECIRAHEQGTGKEILEQLGYAPQAWTAAVGTGCTFMGVARALKAARPDTVCAAVEPEGCQALAGAPVTKARHLIQGTSYGAVPPHWDPSLMDISLAVKDEEVELWRHKLAVQEGLYVGYSAAANVCAAVKLLQSGRLPPDATVATVLCDTGLKY
ncbi:cysteine synthase family protein [Candidimonas humi]|uniref:PLP-dependent cysteine synthase family protein n=1 Tax=Candidimonas humi TaxID=683355 RepID=A0ABV8P193_9BURK|nr:cysteine synthase family protein [Candidimonas humi]MBV6305628.1 cysteine synthase family protein [Candidimonas humi]